MSEHDLPRTDRSDSVSVERLRLAGRPLTVERLGLLREMLGGVGIHIARAEPSRYSIIEPRTLRPVDEALTPEEYLHADVAGIQSRVRAIDKIHVLANVQSVDADEIYPGIELLEGDFVEGLIERLSGDLDYMSAVADALRTSDHPADRGLSVSVLDALQRAYIARGMPFDTAIEAEKWRPLREDSDDNGHLVWSYTSEALEGLVTDVHELVLNGQHDLVPFRDALWEVQGRVSPLRGLDLRLL